MEKEFVPYGLALRMKALGFDEPCLGYYAGDILCTGQPQEIHLDEDGNYKKSKTESFPITVAPTFSQVFKFFRDNYRLSVLIYDCLDDYIGEIVEWTLTDDKIIHEVPNRIETYEETELKSLEKLIEIVESKSE